MYLIPTSGCSGALATPKTTEIHAKSISPRRIIVPLVE